MDKEYKNLCEKLLNDERFKKYSIEGIVLTGSYLHGKTHHKSDIDIFLVVNEIMSCIRNYVFYFNNILVQIRVCSYDKFVKDCKIHERKRPAYIACKVIYDLRGNCEKAINYSKKYYELGPLKLEETEIIKLKSTIKNEIDTLAGLIESGKKITAHLLINELIHMNIEFYNNENNIWMSNNNYLYDELKINNKEMWLLINEIFSTVDIHKKYRLLKKLCSNTINGFEKISGEYIFDEIIK